MGRGKAINEVLGLQGHVGYETAGQWDYIYRTSTVKDTKWDLGDKAELPDGRVFRYAKALSVVHGGHGCEYTYTGLTSYTAFGVAYPVGTRKIVSAAATHSALTKDELKGGYIIIFDGADDTDTTTRGIIGNDVSSANAAITLYLDAAIHTAIVAGTNASEVFQNPFGALKDGATVTNPKAGLPAANASAGQYFWVQTEGLTWAAPQGTVIGNEGMGVMWRHDGSLEAVATALGATIPDVDSTQYAGHLVAGNYSGKGPLFYLRG